ncbi:hypothetical protein MRX96_010943 [Rhipicephalus microplus]
MSEGHVGRLGLTGPTPRKTLAVQAEESSYIISDCLGPYVEAKVAQEFELLDTFSSTMIDESPIPEAKVELLDVLVKYYSTNTENVSVEQLQFFCFGYARADEPFNTLRMTSLVFVRKT